MGRSASEIIASLAAGIPGKCQHVVGSAWFDDDHEWSELGAHFDAAVREFTAAHGPPSPQSYFFPGVDVERLICWEHGELVLYALLEYQDNTRERMLTLGVTDRGSLSVRKTSYWE